MNKIFVICEIYDYEGTGILGISNSIETAMEIFNNKILHEIKHYDTKTSLEHALKHWDIKKYDIIDEYYYPKFGGMNLVNIFRINHDYGDDYDNDERVWVDGVIIYEYE